MPRPRPVTDPDRTRRALARRFDLPDDLAASIPDGPLDEMVAAAARLAVVRDTGREQRPGDLLPHRPRPVGSTPHEVAPAPTGDPEDGYDGGGQPLEVFLGGGRELAAEALRARRPTRLVARRNTRTTQPSQSESDAQRRLRLETELGNVLGFTADREARIARLAAQAATDPHTPGDAA